MLLNKPTSRKIKLTVCQTYLDVSGLKLKGFLDIWIDLSYSLPSNTNRKFPSRKGNLERNEIESNPDDRFQHHYEEFC